MGFSTLSVSAAVTPTVVKTGLSHYTNRKPRHRKPTAHISYDEGLHLIGTFLDFASRHTVDEVQSFTAQGVPHPRWVKVDNVTISQDHISTAAEVIIKQLGPTGLERVGGTNWWQWRQKGGTELKAEWIEMRRHYNERKRKNEKGSRVMLYVHGGGYYFGSVDEHRYQMQRHARKIQGRVFAPRYRLAPQFPFPCGLLDCLAAYLYLLTEQKPSEIILAGDSAGGGMIVSMMCILRDQGLPLPAGAICISPWVDLTHSFPSLVGDAAFDYIPPHGFHHRPSVSWPPPNDEEMSAVRNAAAKQSRTGTRLAHSMSKEAETVQGFSVSDGEAGPVSTNGNRKASAIPGQSDLIALEVDGKTVTLRDQIQLYTTNQLISHPLASPALQPSLGGLPPVLIMTGGGELLRDEQIYLAHKMADPMRYRLGDVYRSQYDPEDILLHKYKPTPVQLQVWDDLCHVAPTLSFTRPAKFMYRSIAQFGAWALARAQKTSIEIVDDDNISVISSGEDTDAESERSTDSIDKHKHIGQNNSANVSGAVGRAGDPLPAFKDHMIRQRVNRHGVAYPLAPANELPATTMDRNEVGVVKPGPVLKWMKRKREWDTRFAGQKRGIQNERIKEYMRTGGSSRFGDSENPPPSALAGRSARDEGIKKTRRSMGLSMWSLWGSRHDEATMRREEEIVDGVKRSRSSSATKTPTAESVILGREVTRARRRKWSAATEQAQQYANDDGRSRSRRRTVTVSDQGQTEGQELSSDPTQHTVQSGSQQQDDITSNISPAPDPTHLTPMFLPKYKSPHLSHLRDGSRDDTVSVRTGYSGSEVPDNASTTAVFAASGIARDRKATNASSLLFRPIDDDPEDDSSNNNLKSERSSILTTPPPGFGDQQHRVHGDSGLQGGAETPASRRSVERLVTNQVFTPVDNLHAPSAMRSPSSVAIVGHPGVVAEVEETLTGNESGSSG